MAKTPDTPPRKSRMAAMSGRGRRPSLQVAALCYRRTSKGLRILLITSRDTGRWVVPKGWPMRRRSEAEAAAREAFEEAGLKGRVGQTSIGIYTYMKRLGPDHAMPCVVRVYPLEVRERLKVYPETGQRKIRWFSRKKAARRVDEPDLRGLIEGFDPDAAPASGQ